MADRDQEGPLQGSELAEAMHSDPELMDMARRGFEDLEAGRYSSAPRPHAADPLRLSHTVGQRQRDAYARDPALPELEQVEVVEELYRLAGVPLSHWDVLAGLAGYLDGRAGGDYALYINLRLAMDDPCPGCGRLVKRDEQREGACPCGCRWAAESVPRHVLMGLGLVGRRYVVRWRK